MQLAGGPARGAMRRTLVDNRRPNPRIELQAIHFLPSTATDERA